MHTPSTNRVSTKIVVQSLPPPHVRQLPHGEREKKKETGWTNNPDQQPAGPILAGDARQRQQKTELKRTKKKSPNTFRAHVFSFSSIAPWLP